MSVNWQLPDLLQATSRSFYLTLRVLPARACKTALAYLLAYRHPTDAGTSRQTLKKFQ
jgi:phytoene/squalene synthetase